MSRDPLTTGASGASLDVAVWRRTGLPSGSHAAGDGFSSLLSGALGSASNAEPDAVGLEPDDVAEDPSEDDRTDALSFSSHALPGDPRGIFVDGNGGLGHQEHPGPTTREPGMRARGLRLDSARPGGAGAEHVRIQSRRTLSGSWGFPPLDGPSQGALTGSRPGPTPGPEASPAAAAELGGAAVAEATSDALPDGPTPPDPARTQTTTESVQDAVDDVRELDASRRPSARAQADAGSDPDSGDPGSPDRRPTTPRPAASVDAIQSAVLDALADPDALLHDMLDGLDPAPGELDPTDLADGAEVMDTDGTEAPLPPARPDGGPARITLDQDLTLEVDVSDGLVEVTLEGDADVVEPLSDLGRSLEDELSRHGWSLGTLAQRRGQGQSRTPLYRARRAQPPSEVDGEITTPSPRIRRGHVVDVIA